jgi:major membrane immunogen (membrane-anchored lipoprotein)
MKKLGIAGLMAICCSVALFAQNYRDGFYFAQDADYANNQKNQVVIEVQGSKIVSATWNILSLNAGAKDLKTIAASGAVPAAATWATQAAAVEQHLVSTQDTKVVTVPGGPANAKPFFDLAVKALRARAVAKGAYKDGWYYAEADAADSYHTKNSALITVVNGTIVDILWNGILQGMPASVNPSKMITSRARGYPMERSARRMWHEQADIFSAALIKAQNPDSIKLKANAAPDGVSGVSIQVKDCLDVVKQALAAAR